MERFPMLFLLLVSSLGCYAQRMPPFTGIDPETGLESDTMTWTDNQGVHFLLLEQSGLLDGEEEGMSSVNVRATHWLKEGGEQLETWSFTDGIEDCLVDAEAKFLAAPQVSDFDDDGYAETWLIIQKSCKGDISPAEVYVVMVDKKQAKYVLSATQKLLLPDGTIDGGDYDLGGFAELPAIFQDFVPEGFHATIHFSVKNTLPVYTYMDNGIPAEPFEVPES